MSNQLYHIGKGGIPRICKAKKKCRYEKHFTSHQEALEFSDNINQQLSIINNFLAQPKFEFSTNDYLAIVDGEREITKDITLVTSSHNGKLHGLEFRIKTPSSVKEKILVRKDAHNVHELWDIVRYTSVHKAENYYKEKTRVLRDLEDKGFHIENEKDTWDGVGYKGINVKLRHPNGTKFELQFHTPESLYAKEQAHILYEAIRMPDIGVLEKEELTKKMNRLFQIEKPKK